MADYPVNLRLDGARVLVVGGGPVGLQKARGLVEAGAVVTVVAPDVVDGFDSLDGAVEVERRPYEPGEAASGYRLVVTATGVREVDQQVFDDADAAGVWVNSADDPERCTFTLPSRVRRGDLLVTVSTAGRSPALSSWLREELETWLGPEHEALLELLAEERSRLRAAGRSSELPGWRTALRSGMLALIREGKLAEARELLHSCLSSSSG